MNLVILGSGTSVPRARRRAPAHLLRSGTETLLLDCGSGSSTALAEQGVSLGELGGILLSHLHLDHTAELAPILFALSNPKGPRRSQDLVIHGPAGTASALAGLEGLYGKWVRPLGVAARAVELSPGESVRLGPIRATALEAVHAKGSLAYRAEADGRVLAYSGDSGPCAGLLAAARGADLFLCECAAGLSEEEGRANGHLWAEEGGRLAAEAGCARLLLTHVYEDVAEADLVEAARRRYRGPVELARDGGVYEVGD
jgi:ribonuclease BN (tRNA processing enzyme)